MPKKQRTLFLYYDPHYFHAALASAAGAEPWPAPKIRSAQDYSLRIFDDAISSVNSVLTLPRDYDVYFCEGTYIFPALAKRLGMLKKEAKIINLTSSPLFYYLKIGRIGGIRRSIAIELLKEVDGFVCVGKMEEELVKGFRANANTMVTYPFIRKQVREKIIRAGRPKLESKKLLFVGNRDTYYKGIDLLIEAFRKARREVPGLELTILGAYDDEVVVTDKDKISCPGQVADVSKYIRESSLYVHLGRGEAFGVSIMEAMLGGLPVLVSSATGAKELVSKVDNGMIVPPSADAAARAIVRYFKLSKSQRLLIAKKGTEEVKRYNEKAMISKFKKDYARLLG